MKLFLRTVLIFIYILLTFIKPNEAYAFNVQNPNTNISYIFEQKSEITFDYNNDKTYFVTQNFNQIEITKNSNKDNLFSFLIEKEALISGLYSNQYLINKPFINNNRVVCKISPILKHAIYTRAP